MSANVIYVDCSRYTRKLNSSRLSVAEYQLSTAERVLLPEGNDTSVDAYVKN